MAAHYATDFTCTQPSNGTDCCNVALGGANGVAGGCAASARVTATTPGRGQINALTRGEESAFVSTPKGKERNNELVRSLEKSKTFFCDKAPKCGRVRRSRSV